MTLMLLLISSIWLLSNSRLSNRTLVEEPGSRFFAAVDATVTVQSETQNGLNDVVALEQSERLDSIVVRIGARDLSIHASAKTESHPIATAQGNATYEIAGDLVEVERHVWIPVLLASGETGWIDAGMPGSRPYLMPVSIELRFAGYLRSGPARGDNAIRLLAAGASFKPFGPSVEADGLTWVPVLDQQTGQIAWLGAMAGSPMSWPNGTEVTVAADSLNLYVEPSVETDVVETFKRGATLTLVGDPIERDGDGWLEVRGPDGTHGYVLATDAGPPY